MSRMGDFAIECGERVQEIFPEKSWDDCMHLVTETFISRNVMYVDGSFNAETGTWGGGGIFVNDIGAIQYFQVHGQAGGESRNVTGELNAVLYGLSYITNYESVDEITIQYDYEGIQKWADGEWQTNKELTRDYVREVNYYRNNGLKINFEKVKAHSGDIWNEAADRLAKSACGLWREI